MGNDDQIAQLNLKVGELNGLFKAHIKELDRERTARNLQRTDDRAERKAMSDNIAALTLKVLVVDDHEKRIVKTEKAQGKIDYLYSKVTIAVSIIGGGLYFVAAGIQLVWPFLKEAFTAKGLK